MRFIVLFLCVISIALSCQIDFESEIEFPDKIHDYKILDFDDEPFILAVGDSIAWVYSDDHIIAELPIGYLMEPDLIHCNEKLAVGWYFGSVYHYKFIYPVNEEPIFNSDTLANHHNFLVWNDSLDQMVIFDFDNKSLLLHDDFFVEYVLREFSILRVRNYFDVHSYFVLDTTGYQPNIHRHNYSIYFTGNIQWSAVLFGCDYNVWCKLLSFNYSNLMDTLTMAKITGGTSSDCDFVIGKTNIVNESTGEMEMTPIFTPGDSRTYYSPASLFIWENPWSFSEFPFEITFWQELFGEDFDENSIFYTAHFFDESSPVLMTRNLIFRGDSFQTMDVIDNWSTYYDSISDFHDIDGDNIDELIRINDNILEIYSLIPSVSRISLESGWNLISLPFAPDDSLVSELLPLSSISEVYEYDNSARAFNETEYIYPNKGYFVFSFSDTSFEVTGDSINSFDLEISPGWNLIGSMSSDISRSYFEIDSIGGIYGYDRETRNYYVPDIIRSGIGYWIFSYSEIDTCIMP